MRLLRLRMQNYRLHTDTTIEWPDGVTAIIGRNGAGKSTILEAIGFALYGTAATRTSKHLIRHSDAAPGDSVLVDLEFELDGDPVRITRELRGKNLTPHATLEVSGRPLVAAGGNSNAAASEEASRLLGMDRAAFFSTLASHQKDLARLADLPATDRKRLILRMLGVDSLDRAIEHARQQRRESSAHLDGLRTQMPDKQAILAAVEEATAAVEDAKKKHAEEVEAHAQATRELVAQRDVLKKLDEQVRSRVQAENRKDEVERERARLLKEMASLDERLVQAQAAKDRAKMIGNAAQERAKAEHDVERIRTLEEAARRRETQLEQVAAIKARWESAAAEAATAPAPPQDLSPLLKEAARFDAEVQEARDQWLAATQRLDEVRDQIKQIRGASGAADCPVCQRPLGDHLETLHTGLVDKQGTLKEEVARTMRILDETQARASQTRERLQAAQEENHALEVARAEHAVLKTRCEELEVQYEEMKRRLPPPSGRLPDLDAAVRALDQARKMELEQARLLGLADELEDLVLLHETARKHLETAKEEVRRADRAIRDTPDVREQLLEAKRREDALIHKERATHTSALQTESRLQLATRGLASATKRKEEWKQQREAVKQQEQVVREWEALAGGRGNGLLERFRSHLVSKIRPAINEEASRLLSQFTAGRYQEMLLDEEYGLFVTEGGVAYTLDRFSGGEADLVHLALRLAVSRLLTQRAGAPEMRLLALDEVFGSLDDERRQNVVGALHSLTALYSQVLLVTHHEGLRDALDAVVEVQEEGGQAVVRIHQG